ncbi:MAG TPA: methyltransferase domain-containing protein, partial [Methylomirabilota bacterium]|nr:methyltransferase domain-containing protein [Methylomirabilota bacterium]
ILDWLGAGRGRRLLDVGAAEGLLSRPLTEQGWRVTAIEVDPEAARAGAGHCERMIVTSAGRPLPDLGGPFDVIVCADVLEHLADPESALERLVTHLAPGGAVVVSIPNVAHLWVRLGLLAGRFDYADRGLLDRTHLRFFTRRTLEALLATAALAAERFTATPVPLYQVVPSRWHGRGLAAVHTLSAFVARSMPCLFAYQFVVLARLARRHAL